MTFRRSSNLNLKHRLFANLHEKYLGLPLLVEIAKNNTFLDLKEKLANKLTRWKEKLLS